MKYLIPLILSITCFFSTGYALTATATVTNGSGLPIYVSVKNSKNSPIGSGNISAGGSQPFSGQTSVVPLRLDVSFTGAGNTMSNSCIISGSTSGNTWTGSINIGRSTPVYNSYLRTYVSTPTCG